MKIKDINRCMSLASEWIENDYDKTIDRYKSYLLRAVRVLNYVEILNTMILTEQNVQEIINIIFALVYALPDCGESIILDQETTKMATDNDDQLKAVGVVKDKICEIFEPYIGG